MKDNLLELLSSGKVYSLTGLALELGESEEIVKAKLECYQMLGLVKKTSFESDGSCNAYSHGGHGGSAKAADRKHKPSCSGHYVGCSGCASFSENADPSRQTSFWEVVER